MEGGRSMSGVKQEVREFYDQVGWQFTGETIYQNARYEDLRPVTRRYIHDCHLRVARYLTPSGLYFLDAGSGPIQYPEYLEYSRDYKYRVCADISMTALRAARKRIGEHGLFVLADIANLPFKEECFDGIVSLHTIHHLAENEQHQAYLEIYRVLASKRAAVVVNGWSKSSILSIFEPLIRLANWIRNQVDRGNQRDRTDAASSSGNGRPAVKPPSNEPNPKGTFSSHNDLEWVMNQIASRIPVEIYVWRTVSVRFTRALIHPRLAGASILRILYALEERFPKFFGEHGKYPLILIHKPQED
jgi:SAM-dependent methyltransferase